MPQRQALYPAANGCPDLNACLLPGGHLIVSRELGESNVERCRVMLREPKFERCRVMLREQGTQIWEMSGDVEGTLF